MMNLFLIIRAACIFISGISIGAWTSGEQQRASLHSETKNIAAFKQKLR